MSQSCSSQSSPSSTNERGNGEHSQCFEADAPLDAILSCIELHHKVLILMRGLPGSGKSYLARNLEKRGLNGRVFSTDDFFCSPNGSYVFDQNKLSDYHAQNVGRVRDAIGEDRTPVIVDNTNVFGVHMKPYANLVSLS
uniref:Uncharacterized protein n=1 Tax=Plectus sambesii TaxID=2011161 RepID=A0A914WY62_9BILA